MKPSEALSDAERNTKGSMFGAQARSLLLEFTPDGKPIQTVGQGATNLK